MMDGRVKTLHPRVHGGILALRDESSHVASMEAEGIRPIDLVCVNLYPFESTVAKPDVAFEDAIEQIDIGGPSMVRSAAKNHRFVAIVTDPADYGRVLDEMESNGGGISDELRRELALKAFQRTAAYDAAISAWMFERSAASADERVFPESHAVVGAKALDLRYGENPHQAAAFYSVPAGDEPTLASAELLGGKALSYNNLVDLDAALGLAKEFDAPFVAVCKHNNPCGAAVGDTIAAALADAWAGDPLSAFGSVLAFNRPVDVASAEFLTSENRFVEAIVAPSFEDEALAILRERPKWGRNVRLLACGDVSPGARDADELELKRLAGGFLLQERDLAASAPEDCKVVTRAEPTPTQVDDLLFGEKVGKHVKSNTIVLAKGGRVTGVGAGQMSRVDAVEIAVKKAGEHAAGSVLASDAFFPFPDGVEAAMDAGVAAILQPGGSRRDDEVIAACDARNVPMVFTGTRHFRH